MEESPLLPAVLPSDSPQKRLAFVAALIVPLPVLAIIPFGQVELPRVDSYIPVVDTVMLINDSARACRRISVHRIPGRTPRVDLSWRLRA